MNATGAAQVAAPGPARTAIVPVEIVPLPRAEISRIAHLRLPPSQGAWVGEIAEMVGDTVTLRDFFCARAVVQSGAPRVVGFFEIDRAFERRDPRLSTGAHGLRGLLIGGQFQRFGFGTGLLSALPGFLRGHYRDLDAVYLSVDRQNAPAIRAYRAFGWRDTGLAPFAGRSGPEDVMVLSLAQI